MLTATSEYALRALTHLAALPPGRAVLGRDLAAATGVSPDYLSKIMLALRNAGLVGAVRGTGGGYRLVRAPDRVRLVDVIEVFEGVATRPKCLLGSDRECSNTASCTAHSAYKAVRDSYVRFLEKTTLSQISGAPESKAGTKPLSGDRP